MAKRTPKNGHIESFNFQPGRIVAKKYEIIRPLGAGWEGEVYLMKERSTGIERAGKFFFPQRNTNNRIAVRYAKQLHKLQHCPVLIRYYAQDTISFNKQPVTFLVSEFVEGKQLSTFLKNQPGKRLTPFQALHLLHALCIGIESIHKSREYHGDLHSENIIVHRCGLGFELKLMDMFHWSAPKPENMQDDVCDMIRIFYDSLGGQKHYAKQAPEIKRICCGLKRTLILKRFKTASKLRKALENLEWQ